MPALVDSFLILISALRGGVGSEVHHSADPEVSNPPSCPALPFFHRNQIAITHVHYYNK